MDLLEKVDAIIDGRHLLTHPFYRSWVDGTLPFDALREYARQYYAFESSFPRVLSCLHSRSERADVRQALLENLWDEEHGDVNHQELWLRFAEGIGVHRDEVTGATWSAATDALVRTYRNTSQEAPVAAGVAAVYAYERQVPSVAQAKMDGLRQRYGIDESRTLGFFETHAVLDLEHSEAERRIVVDLGPDNEDEVLEATEGAVGAWWGFLDAVTPQGSE